MKAVTYDMTTKNNKGGSTIGRKKASPKQGRFGRVFLLLTSSLLHLTSSSLFKFEDKAQPVKAGLFSLFLR